MPFLRRHGQQILLLHGFRQGARIRHRTLHRFRRPADLQAALDDGAWETLQQQVEEAHPDVTFDWPALASSARELLADAPTPVEEKPDDERVLALRRALRDLQRRLRSLRLERDRPILLAAGHDLRDAVHYGFVLLDSLSVQTEQARMTRCDVVFRMLYRDEETEGLVERARADFHAGRRKKARERFAEARGLDPLDPDVLTSEANCHLSVDALDAAEPLYREAAALARHRLPLGRRVLGWGELEVRPYARAVHGLALVHEKRGRPRDAVRCWQELLALCPDDGIGARYCLGAAYHRLGELDAAVDCYTRNPEFPEQLYGLAAALLARGEEEAAVPALLDAFLSNPYVPHLLLGDRVRQPDVWHSLNTETLEWARDTVDEDRDLWTKPTLAFLRRVWSHPEVQEAVHELQALRRTLKDAPVGSDERARAVDALSRRREDLLPKDAVRRVTQAVTR